jgi:tRNA uridine 5-carboxymethylaminomethyl modification enzyme
MKAFTIAAVALGLVAIAPAAQADIVCTQHGGCRETGKRIISDRLAESAMYGGAISARGPRYCPSVEDKVVRFPHAERHQLFLEPEGHDTTELYVNGLSTSLPAPVQLEILRSIEGLAGVQMTRAGYAIEYDYFPPTQLWPSLESRAIPGLFFAGQVNGTTGYEEAAGQGLAAGLNAGLRARGAEPVILGRETSYIGVLIDDLITRGVDEPYRLFTSRSEFRLTVRQDNALRRLAPIAVSLGMFDAREQARVESRLEREAELGRRARETALSPVQANAVLERSGSAPIREAARIAELARRHGVGLRPLIEASGGDAGLDADALTTVELELKYAGISNGNAFTRRAEADVPAGAGGGSSLLRVPVAVDGSTSEAFGEAADHTGAGCGNSRRKPQRPPESSSGD